MGIRLNQSLRGASLATLIVGGAVLGIACGGDDDNSSGSSTSSTSSTTSSGSTGTTTSSSTSSSGASGTTTSSSSSSSGTTTSSSSSSSGSTAKTDTPTFTTTPAANGTTPFTTSPVSVTIADTTPGATIFYTTDGTNPTITSQVANGPITISQSGMTQVRAIAAATGFENSDVGSVVIDIEVPPNTLTPPTASPNSGTQNNTFNVALTDQTANATFCYTTDGVNAPACTSGVCTAGSQYNAATPIPVNADNTKIIAVACEAGATTTAAATFTYNLAVADVTATPTPPGNFNGPTSVTLSTTTQNATIHYTTDGTTVATCANGTSATNTATITVTQNTTVSAIACRTGFQNSNVATFAYGSNTAAPIFVTGPDSAQNGNDVNQVPAPTGTTFAQDVRLLIPNSQNAAGATVDTRAGTRQNGDVDCFTTDGSTPACSVGTAACTAGTRYVPVTSGSTTTVTSNGGQPVVQRDGQVVNVIRCRANAGASLVASYTYNLKVGNLAASYVTRDSTATGGPPTTGGVVPAPASMQNDETDSNINTGSGVTTEFVAGSAGQTAAQGDHGLDAVQTGQGSTQPGATNTTAAANEKVCYTLDSTTPSCTQVAPVAPATVTTSVACGTGSTDDSVTPIGSSSYANATATGAQTPGQPQRTLPLTVKAIACKPNYQNSPERDLVFGAPVNTVTVTATPTSTGNLSGGQFDNDQYLTFTPSQALTQGQGQICFTRGADQNLPDPTCSTNKTACGTGTGVGTVYTYDGTSNNTKPHVTADTSNYTTPTASQNHFKVIVCKPGTTGTVLDAGTYHLRVGDPTATVNGTQTSGGSVPRRQHRDVRRLDERHAGEYDAGNQRGYERLRRRDRSGERRLLLEHGQQRTAGGYAVVSRYAWRHRLRRHELRRREDGHGQQLESGHRGRLQGHQYLGRDAIRPVQSGDVQLHHRHPVRGTDVRPRYGLEPGRLHPWQHYNADQLRRHAATARDVAGGRELVRDHQQHRHGEHAGLLGAE